jgi:hypothetical protein
MGYTPQSTNISDFEEIIVILSITRMRLWRAFPALPERACVGSIPTTSISDAQNVPSFRRWRFEMKLSPLTRIKEGTKRAFFPPLAM